MYIAALRMADDFGCDTIGIQYQQGLKDLAPASDLAEGLLNNVDRPPVTARDNGRVLYEGRALPHFNESGRVCGAGRAGDQPDLDRAGLRSGVYAARCALWRAVPREWKRGVRVGVRDFGRGAAGAPDGRIRRRGERAPAADVLPFGRRRHQGREQAG